MSKVIAKVATGPGTEVVPGVMYPSRAPIMDLNLGLNSDLFNAKRTLPEYVAEKTTKSRSPFSPPKKCLDPPLVNQLESLF